MHQKAPSFHTFKNSFWSFKKPFSCFFKVWRQSVRKIVRIASPPPHSMLVASFLAHSWWLLPDIAVPELAQHWTTGRWNSGYFWAYLTFFRTFSWKYNRVSIIFVTDLDASAMIFKNWICCKNFTALFCMSKWMDDHKLYKDWVLVFGRNLTIASSVRNKLQHRCTIYFTVVLQNFLQDRPKLKGEFTLCSSQVWKVKLCHSHLNFRYKNCVEQGVA